MIVVTTAAVVSAPMPRTPRAEVAKHVARADKAFAGIIGQSGPPPAQRPIRVDQRFGTLASSILHQQLAVAAAAALPRRGLAAGGGPNTAAGLHRAGPEMLAACGVSGPKRLSLFDLADKTLDGTLDFTAIGRMRDDAVEEVLTCVRGIGPWTAHMFCMFTLGREDVWPVGDYGVRAGWTRLHGGDEIIAARDLLEKGERFRPHRSAVAWYCWRALEGARSAPPPT
jgi:3-methyladenine DNA glycosylase/8-oxoguanine DNA glycosylase